MTLSMLQTRPAPAHEDFNSLCLLSSHCDEEDRRKAAFGRISWKEMLTQPKFAKKAAQFMRSLGLIDQIKSVTFDLQPICFWQ